MFTRSVRSLPWTRRPSTIDECKRQEHSAFEQTKWLERAALVLIVVSMGMLIALAWRNF
jgi:hypothetical protein